MLTAPFVLVALTITVLLGAPATAYLWLRRRQHLEIASGIKTLAAMRWREFSRFVIEALHVQGFEPKQVEPYADKSLPEDLVLERGDQTWLLSCKQPAEYRTTPKQVNELAKSVRHAGASGGIIATLGHIDAGARTHASNIELLDGPTLWSLIDPLLPPSLHMDLAERARTSTIRSTELAWLMSMLLGIAVALLLVPVDPVPAQAEGADGQPRAATAQATTPATPPAALPEPGITVPVPRSEAEQRDEVVQMISAMPGIEQATWSTPSTLLVDLQDDTGEQQIADLCVALERYDTVRASRLQLQPPPGSDKPVRFKQCFAY
jgi:restriction system protein